MIIYIRNEPNPKTGKGLFASRLVGAIQKQGETVCCSYSGEHDVSLHLVKIREWSVSQYRSKLGCNEQ
jgi:hypothetical protein